MVYSLAGLGLSGVGMSPQEYTKQRETQTDDNNKFFMVISPHVVVLKKSFRRVSDTSSHLCCTWLSHLPESPGDSP